MVASSTAVSVFRKIAAESDFQCIVPDDSHFSSFSGFITVASTDFPIRVSKDCSRFESDGRIFELIGSRKALEDRLAFSADIYDFLVELRDLLERALTKQRKTANHSKQSLPPAQYYECILSEIAQIGWDHVASMHQDMTSIDLQVSDKQERDHMITVLLPYDYPMSSPRFITSLPLPFELKWEKQYSLKTVMKKFEAEVQRFNNFFRVMDDFDTKSWVLEPEHPTRRDLYRRLALGKQCSIRIEIDARAPIKGFPECRFLGAESAIAPFRRRLNENIHQWDMSGDVLPRENLERILQVQFESRSEKEQAQTEELNVECGICYTYRLEDRVPDVACDLEKCAKPYHKECLAEWLRALPDTRESFGTITGKCVYCEEPISVSVK